MKTRNINVEMYCNTSLQNTKAFTFVELIVSIGIILLISTIGYMSYSGSLETKDNTKVISDLATIDNSFKSYFTENKSLPEVSGNKSFYKDDGTYAHDASDSAYGVSSFVSEKTLSAKYLNSLPLDPRTGYYYAYGKTINNKFYEIAGVEKKDNNYKSVVAGNYKTIGDELTNLVREYNGPEFVANNSTEHFPYNPEEKILTAQVNDYSGSVSVIHNGTTISDGTGILDTALVTGDTIKAGTGSSVNIYFSDGSKSYLGDSSRASELNLTNMSYKQDSNLFTKIKLVLNVGTLWTAASKMSDNSDFEVYSNDTVAAVRGTIFGVTVNPASGSNPSSTNVVVARGDVEINKLIKATSSCTQARELIKSDSLESAIKSDDSDEETPGIVTNTYGSCSLNLPGTIDSDHIKVSRGEKAKGMKSDNASSTGVVSTGAIISIPGNTTSQTNITNGDFSFNAADYKIKLINVTNPSTPNNYYGFQAKIRVDKKLLDHFTYFKLNDTYYKSFESSMNTGTYTFDGLKFFSSCNPFDLNCISITKPIKEILLDPNISGKFELKACRLNPKGEEICSKSLNLKVPNGPFNYSPKCQKAIVPFGGEQVDNLLCDKGYELVGYAGYNNNSFDILSSNNFNAITSTGMLNRGATRLYDTGTQQFSSLSSSGLVWGITSTGDSDSSPNTRFNLGGIYGGSDYLTYNLPIGSTRTSGLNYYKWVYNNVTTNGVFPDNVPDADFIKYNISPLSLSGSDFAIEMSVRGAALKRNSGYYYLFHTDMNKVQLYNENATHNLSGNNNNNIEISSYSGELSDNLFYKVQYICQSGKQTIKIVNDDGKQISTSVDTHLCYSNFTELYIGSNNSSESQWNDIIDYVKIYKR